MRNMICRISGTLVFPEGLMPGEESKSNKLTIARNGQGKPLLRGTALAGALRSRFVDGDAKTWFGESLDGEEDTKESRVQVVDSLLDASDDSITSRMHHLRIRHNGVTGKGALFSVEHLPPGTTCPLLLYVNMCGISIDKAEDFLQKLASFLATELTLGGSRSRGLGRVKCKDNCLTLHRYDLSHTDGYIAWTDARYLDRRGLSLSGGEKLEVKANTKTQTLTLTLSLSIPRGEDFLIAEDQNMQPQKTKAADGQSYWRIPGASLRGLLRSWMTRLAVRQALNEGKEPSIRDSQKRWDDSFEDPKTYKPDMIGWGFFEKEEHKYYQEHPGDLFDPILDLFGSFYKQGRLHITDALSSRPIDQERDIQERTHVAIDRFSGGANEGALFTNQVLIASDLHFSTTITITQPQPDEVAWLIQTLRALHVGIITIGSSKSAGRLEIRGIEAKGKLKDKFVTFAEEIN